MQPTRLKWIAVATFAALLTIGEAFAIQAAARDARRWMASDEVRAVRRAGEAVAAVMTGMASGSDSGCLTAAQCRRARDARIRTAIREARQVLRERRVEVIRARLEAQGI